MKRIITYALLAAVTAGTSASGAWADGTGRDDATPRGESERMPPPPDGMHDRLPRQLGLSSKQQTDIKALQQAGREKAMPLVQQMAQYRTQLQEALRADTIDETALKTIAAKQAATEVELLLAREKVRRGINALLTPEQRSRADGFRFPPPPPPYGREPGEDCGCGRRPGPPPPPPPCGDDQRHRPGGDRDRRPGPDPDYSGF